jgi:hypothetical protein
MTNTCAIAATFAVSVVAAIPHGGPALATDPLAAGDAVRPVVLEEITPVAEWQVGGAAVAFGRTEIRRIGDFAHVRAVVTRADGGAVDPETVAWIRDAARPPTLSGVLRFRDGRWMLLDAAIERADTSDPDAPYRRWRLPAGLLPPDCAHRQNWGCGGTSR